MEGLVGCWGKIAISRTDPRPGGFECKRLIPSTIHFLPPTGLCASSFIRGDVRSESTRHDLHQQERSDACQSDVKVLSKNLSAKAVIDHSAKEHA